MRCSAHQLVLAIFEDGLDFVASEVVEVEEMHLSGTPRAEPKDRAGQPAEVISLINT